MNQFLNDIGSLSVKELSCRWKNDFNLILLKHKMKCPYCDHKSDDQNHYECEECLEWVIVCNKCHKTCTIENSIIENDNEKEWTCKDCKN